MTSASVRAAGASLDLNHRDPEYLNLIRETKERLLEVYPETSQVWIPYLMGGSGTLAVEAMITSCIQKGPVLVLENGYYSSRIREIFEIHSIPFTALSFGWLDEWHFAAIEEELSKGYEAVIGTHNETTTGRLNDIGSLGKLSKLYGANCLVDVMSSFGADNIDFACLDAVCASGNKCLHSIPGVAFVLLNQDFQARLDDIPRRSYYMNLAMYEGDVPPLTPPVPALFALRQALREYPSGGISGRHHDYRTKNNFLREELAKRGLNCPLTEQDSSCTLLMIDLPTGFTFDQWFAANSEAGYIIYGCKGALRERYFQVSNMGDISMDDLRNWLDAVDRILKAV